MNRFPPLWLQLANAAGALRGSPGSIYRTVNTGQRIILLAASASLFFNLPAAAQMSGQQSLTNDSLPPTASSEWIPPHAVRHVATANQARAVADSHVKIAEFSMPIAENSSCQPVPNDLSQFLKSPPEVTAGNSFGDAAIDEPLGSANGQSEDAESKSNLYSWSGRIKGFLGAANLTNMLGSLAIVLGGYFGLVWVLRKLNPRSTAGLPQEAVDVIGFAPFGPRRTLQLVRLGTKLLLLVNGAEGTHSIGEITEPREVEYLASLCSGRRTARRTDSLAALRRLVDHIQPPTSMSGKSSFQASKPSLEQIVHSLQDAIRHTSGGNVFEA